ncbi:MAG: hypothetical protein AAF234_06540 [Pseudomonadota bacterium]
MFIIGFGNPAIKIRPNVISLDKRRINPVVSSLDPEFFDALFEELEARKFIKETFDYNAFRKNYSSGVLSEIPFDCPDEYIIRIWDTPAFVVCFKITFDSVVNGKKPKHAIEPISKTSDLGKFFAAALKPFDGAQHDEELGLPFVTKRASISGVGTFNVFQELRKSGAMKLAAHDDPDDKDQPVFSQFEKKVVRECKARVQGLIDYEFDKKLKRAPILNRRASDLRCVTNSFFIGKVFDRQARRYGQYFYNTNMIIAEEQKRQITRSLEHTQPADFIPFEQEVQHNLFWHMASSPEGRKEIVRLLEAPVRSNVRLFSDSVLMSGSALIKPDFFNRSAVGWVKPGGKHRDRNDALLQLACYHYVMQLASPVWPPINARELSVVALPFRCSGGIWMAKTYVRENHAGEIDGLINPTSFYESALLYHAIARESERRLRRRARGRYTDALGDLLVDANALTRRKYNDSDEALFCLDAEAIERFQDGSRAVRRVFPFDGISFRSQPEEGELVSLRGMRFDPCDNEFFDRLTQHGYLKEDENERRLAERILLSLITRPSKATRQDNGV